MRNTPPAKKHANYSVTAKPNSSLTPRQKVWVFVAISVLPILVSTVFSMLGAWMVLPFAGLELLALAGALYWLHLHAGDYERLVIEGAQLRVERKELKNKTSMVFDCYWAKVVMKGSPGGEQRLWLRSHGREFEFGRYMSNDARLILAGHLRRRTGLVYS